MSDLEFARRLLAAAERELAALERMSDAQAFADQIFGFHAQQAVEKMLKAWLCVLGEEYPLTHDLERLGASVAARAPEASAFRDLQEYTPYAGTLRFEGDEERVPPFAREAAVRRIRDLREVVRGIVPA